MAKRPEKISVVIQTDEMEVKWATRKKPMHARKDLIDMLMDMGADSRKEAIVTADDEFMIVQTELHD